MSNGGSASYRWITRSRFRDCSTRQSRSKAGLCPYTLRTIADRAEPTFELLRYVLGGNRPSQTDPLTLFPVRLHGQRVRHSTDQGWYFTDASPRPGGRGSQAPTYSAHGQPNASIRLQ